MQIKYRTPREALGKWLAENDVGGEWPGYYNEEQREYWHKKADKLILFIKRHGLL